MIQNVGHTFADDAFGRVGLFPGLGIYFSSLRRDFADSSHGVHLNLDPATFPKFGRVFEDVDALGSSAKNIYTRRGIPAASPAKPVRITWTVTRRNVVKDPAGEYSKALDGRWVPLTGVFAVWNFRVVIDGKNFDVADYYLPVQYAEYISPTDPLMLHQEYFGSAQQILASQQGEVRYTQMSASDGSTSFPLNN